MAVRSYTRLFPVRVVQEEREKVVVIRELIGGWEDLSFLFLKFRCIHTLSH